MVFGWLGMALAMPVVSDEGSLLLTDVDGDGWVDLVLDHGQRVHFNEGGTLGPAQQLLPNPDDPLRAVADLDGDGLPELCEDRNEELFCYPGQGRTLGAATLAGSWHTQSLQPIDIDSDGDIDFVAVVEHDPALLRNDGSGTLSLETFQGTDSYDQVALGDVDGDGDTDAIAFNDTPSDVVWFESDGQNLAYAGLLMDWNFSADSVAMVDLTGDGYPDMVSGGTSYASFRPWDAQQAGPRSTADTGPWGPGTDFYLPFEQMDYDGMVTAADLDGDGTLNVVVSARHGGVIWDALGNGVATELVPPLGTTYSTRGIAAADIDQDGRLDVVALDDDIRVIYNPVATPRIDVLHRSADHTGRGFGDFDEDGTTDIVYTSADGTFWIPSDSKTTGRPQELVVDAMPQSLHKLDLNGDGIDDLVVREGSYSLRYPEAFSTELLWMEGDGFGGYGPRRRLALDPEFAWTLADLHGDGETEYLYAIDTGLYRLETDGAGGVQGQEIAQSPGPVWDLAVGDVDGDGDADLVTVSAAGLSIHHNEPAGLTTMAPIVMPIWEHYDVELADLDEDGDLDVYALTHCQIRSTYYADCIPDTERLVEVQNTPTGWQYSTIGAGYKQPFGAVDWDLDGSSELVVQHAGHVGIVVSAQGSFAPITPDRYAYERPMIADFDGDGGADIVFTGGSLNLDVLWNGERTQSPLVDDETETTTDPTTNTPTTEVDTGSETTSDVLRSGAEPKSGGCGCEGAGMEVGWSLLVGRTLRRR